MTSFSTIARISIVIIACWTAVGASHSRLAGPDPNGWLLESDTLNEAEIADKVIEMYEASSMAERLKWYEMGGEKSLKSLGTDALAYSANDPLYNFYVDGFRDVGETYEKDTYGIFDKSPAETYGHSIVTDILEIQNFADGLEVESILVTGLWMRVYHYLYDIFRGCGTGKSNTSLMRENLDRAAALWIGQKQIYGSNTVGVMLYNLAERASVEFGQDKGEAAINSKFLSILEKIRLTIIDAKCSIVSETTDIGNEIMNQHLSDAVRQMNALLVQRLIHFMATDVDTKFTKLYALSLVPQIRTCSTVEYKYFMEKVVFNTSYDQDSFETSIRHLQNMYSCLGVTCDDIGSYSGGRVPQCNESDIEPVLPLAGYVPANDVRRYAKVDRDIRQIFILLDQGSIVAAKNLYWYGRNMVNGDSIPTPLRSLAREFNTLKQAGGQNRLYNMFEDYYENNSAYADKLVWDAFDGTEAKSQVAVPGILQTIVVPHFAVRAFFEAVDLCEENRLTTSLSFDKGVAALVGSLEGISQGGSNDGLSWFSLMKKFCPYFNCDDTTYPSLNVQIMALLQDSKNAIMNGSCSDLKLNVIAVESLLLVPCIQGLLYHSKMRQDQPTSILHHETAKVFAKAIVPVVKKVSQTQAYLIESNIFTNIGDEIDAEQVWSAIFNVVDHGTTAPDLGVLCRDVGNPNLILNGKSFCEYPDAI